MMLPEAMGTQPRQAVVDLGSNSVRLVVFQGLTRTPAVIFNEKAVLRLGRGLQATGRLDDQAMAQAETVLRRYHALARAMDVATLEVLATSAVRDAANGAAFVARLHAMMPEVPIRILPGAEEAALSAAGVLCGIPDARGVLADIGGGSLELVRLAGGMASQGETLRLGVIRLAERAEGSLPRARAIVESDLGGMDWLETASGQDLYAVGGTFRALAHIHIEMTNYPLKIVHHHVVALDAARDFAALIAEMPRRALERLPGAPRRRIDDLPYAAVVLHRLLRTTNVARVVFSANGLREGWYLHHIPERVRTQDPMLAASRDLGRHLGRHPDLPLALFDWTTPLFAPGIDGFARLREAACWLSDIGSQEHPDYRAEQAFLRLLRQPGVALSHPDRAFLATCLAVRYEADPASSFLAPARQLLDAAAWQRAETLGHAFRLAYTLSGGTPDLLAATTLCRGNGHLTLQLDQTGGVFLGESVTRRLGRLAQALNLAPKTCLAA